MDCGLYQGREEDFEGFNRDWPFNPEQIDVLILSHAHIDHCGRIPKLVKDGFRGRIICTEATRNLASIMLQDSAKIQEDDAEFMSKRLKKNIQPLYTIEDATRCMPYFVGTGYEQWHRVCRKVDVLFRDAGHILGAASVTLRIKQEDGSEQYFGFTGDIGRPNRPILRDPVPMPPVDWLICESTYGGKTHTSAPDSREELLDIIQKTCLEKKGKLIIPAFSVGRTQELLYMLDNLETEGRLPRVKVYVDSPLAINATDIYLLHPECYDDELKDYLAYSGHPFAFENLFYYRDRKDSKRINEIDEPCVIISASGMAQAGRVRHHIFHNIENPATTILIVGYCAPGTLGEQLVRKPEFVKIFGEEKRVNAEICSLSSLSAHADQPEMIEFLRSQEKERLKKIFLVHGDLERQVAFREALVQEGYDHVIIPALGDKFELNDDE